MKFKTLFAAAAACVLAFASCTNEGASSIEGEYVGINKSQSADPMPPMPPKPASKQMGGDSDEPVAYIVKDYKNGKCTLEIPASHPCVLEGCTVTESNGIYTIKHDGITNKYYKMTKGFEATIQGDTFKTTYNMIIVAMEGFMPNGLIYTFEGTRK